MILSKFVKIFLVSLFSFNSDEVSHWQQIIDYVIIFSLFKFLNLSDGCSH